MNDTLHSHGVPFLGPLHESLARAKGLRALAAAALLGALAALAFAPFHLTPILIVSFTGLVWLIDGARGSKRWGRAVFARGWGYGFGFFLVSLHWTAAPFLVEPEKHAIFIWMPLILLPGGMALIWGAVIAMAAAFWSASPSRVFVFALFFGIGEWVRGTLFGGFPWNLAGTSWIPGGNLSQAASLGGVYWLTLLTLFACAAPAALVDTRQSRANISRFLPVLASVIVLASLWAWGGQRISEPVAFTDIDIVLMDVGVPQDEKFVDGQANPEVFRQYLAFLDGLPSEPDDIVIWPEGATGGRLLEARQLEPTAAYLGTRTLIAGSVTYCPPDAEGVSEAFDCSVSTEDEAWYNSLAVITSESAVTGAAATYNKHRLVPVGELPVARIIPFGRALSGLLPGAIQRMATNGFEPGAGPSLVYGAGIPPFVAMICYEGLFPNVGRDAQRVATDRADWMVLISNDGWFGAVVGPAQHYAQNRYRAIETGLPMARVAARGTSAIIDGKGRATLVASGVVGDLPGWEGRVGRGKLPTAENFALFQTRAGQILFPATLVLFAVFAFLVWRR